MEITLNFVLIVAHARYAKCDPIVAPRVATDRIPENVQYLAQTGFWSRIPEAVRESCDRAEIVGHV